MGKNKAVAKLIVPQEAMQAAAAFAQNATLAHVAFAKIAGVRHPPTDADAGQLAVDLKWGAEQHTLSEGLLSVHVEMEARFLRAKPANNRAVVAEMNLDCVLDYVVPRAEIPAAMEHALPAFININVIHNAWPYLRERIQNLCTAMGMKPFVLAPLIVDTERSGAPPQLQTSPRKGPERRKKGTKT